MDPVHPGRDEHGVERSVAHVDVGVHEQQLVRLEEQTRERLPDWHEQSKPSSYSFPSSEAASTFAQGHYQPGRSVIIHFPNGERWDGTKWL